MSKLIDDLVTNVNTVIHISYYQYKIDGKIYFIKPMMNWNVFKIKNRITDAIRILRGKSIAVHFKEDE